MRRTLVGLLVFFTLTGTPAVRAQQQIQAFASVVDSSGTPVSGLTPGDFMVTENGAEGKVVSVEPIDWPVRVSIIIDNGVGMGQWLSQVRSGVKGLLNALPDGIETSLSTTAPQPRFVTRATTDRQALLKGADLISPDDGAAMFVQALTEAAARLDKETRNYFPVVIILGSTAAEGGAVSERDGRRMLERFSQRAATVHVVLLSTAPRSGQFGGKGANQIYVGMTVAKATGGRYETISAPSRIATLLPEIGEQVARSHALQSRQYRLTARRPASASGPLAGLSVSTRAGLTLQLTPDGRIP